MGKVLELSEDTYHQLADLAQHQQRTLEEMLRLCLAAYEESQYQQAHQQMVAEGLLVSLPAPPLTFTPFPSPLPLLSPPPPPSLPPSPPPPPPLLPPPPPLSPLPPPPPLPGETEEGDDFEPVEIPGKPLSEIILEERR